MKRRKKSDNIKYRDKCDKLISAFYKGKSCIICGSTNSAGHHLAGRGNAVRHNLDLIVPLCASHHIFSNVIAAHSSNSLAVVTFVEFIKNTYPKTFALWRKNKRKVGIKVDFKTRYEELKKELSEINK